MINESKIKIPGPLESASKGGYVTTTADIVDATKDKTQAQVNTIVDTEITTIQESLGSKPDGAKAAHERITDLWTELNAKQYAAEAIELDEHPVSGSTKLLTSGTIHTEKQNILSKTGYYECSTAAAIAAKTVSASGYVLEVGGNIHIKMTNVNTANSATLSINNTTAKTLYYNGEPVSANNSWEEGETLNVFYDGTYYQAFNIQGGGVGSGAYDISEKNRDTNGPATYSDFEYILNTSRVDTLIPVKVRTGGMSIKFLKFTPATYSVVKTENLETAPIGTLLNSASNVVSGTYTADSLTDFSTPPSNVKGTATYYYAVTTTETVTVEGEEQEVSITTYTSWVITKETDNFYDYEQWRYTKKYTNDTTGNTAFVCICNWQSTEKEAIIDSNNIVDSDGIYRLLHNVTEIDISGYSAGGYWIRDSDRKWASSTTANCILVPITGNTKYVFVPTDGKRVRFCFLTSNAHTSNTVPAFCTGYNTSDVSSAKTIEVVSPSDATYLYLLVQPADSNNYKVPKHVYTTKDKYLDVSLIDEEPSSTATNRVVSSAGVDAAIKASALAVKEEFTECVTEIDLSDRFYLKTYNPGSANVGDTVSPLSITSQSSAYAAAAVECEEGDKFTISCTRTGSTHYPVMFLDANNKVLARYQNGNSSSWVNHAVTAPTNAKKLLVTAKVNEISFKKVFSSPTSIEKSGVIFTEYNDKKTVIYGTENTRNGYIWEASGNGNTMTVTEGTSNKVITDPIWMPKDTRITISLASGEAGRIIGVDCDMSTNDTSTHGNTLPISVVRTYKVRVYTDSILAFMFWKTDNSDFTPSELESWVKVEYPMEETVADYNSDKDNLIYAASRHPSVSASYGAPSAKALPMFCVVTDVHDSWGQLERALDYADSKSEILATLFLGDLTGSTGLSPDKGQHYKNPVNNMIMRHTKPLLRVSGNHDSNLTRTQYMAAWFPSHIVTKTGETHPEGCPWWYKDFSISYNDGNSTTTKTIRIIGNFDNDSGSESASSYYGTSDEQYNWICEKLDECDENTCVLILRHYPAIPLREENLITDWRPKQKYWTPGATENIGKLCGIVNAWMYGLNYSSGNVSHDFTEGGNRAKNFICYLTGHYHKDYILEQKVNSQGDTSEYPQINIGQCCTAVKWGNNGFRRGDIPSSTTGKIQDAFNVISINWYQSHREVRLIRIGSDVTTDLRDRKAICIELPNTSEE